MSRRDARRAWIPCRRCVTSEARLTRLEAKECLARTLAWLSKLQGVPLPFPSLAAAADLSATSSRFASAAPDETTGCPDLGDHAQPDPHFVRPKAVAAQRTTEACFFQPGWTSGGFAGNSKPKHIYTITSILPGCSPDCSFLVDLVRLVIFWRGSSAQTGIIILFSPYRPCFALRS
jgi:hypothetical protein